ILGGILPRGTRQKASTGRILDTLADKRILSILTTSGLVQLGGDLYQFYIPIYGHEIGLSATSIGAVLATYGAAAFLVRLVMARLVLRIGEEKLLAYSFYL